jgi:hypothetical protein
MGNSKDEEDLEIIFLSDSIPSPTNFVFRISSYIQKKFPEYNLKFVKFSYMNAIKLIFKLLYFSFNNKILIVHSHHTKSLSLNIVLKIISRILLNKYFLSFHTIHYELKRFNGLRLIVFKISRFFIDRFSCVSESLFKSWFNLLDKNIDIIYAGISKDEKSLIRRKSIQEKIIKKNDFFNITWVGRFEIIKRPELFFETLLKVNIPYEKKINVFVAGDGTSKSLVEKYIYKINNLNKNINAKYLGMIDRKELFQLVSLTDLYINTSESESLCLAVIEFLSNPYCKLILPNIEVFEDYYTCSRVQLFNKFSSYQLRELVEHNISLNNTSFQDNLEKNYPKMYKKLTLENTCQYYLDLFDYSIKNLH